MDGRIHPHSFTLIKRKASSELNSVKRKTVMVIIMFNSERIKQKTYKVSGKKSKYSLFTSQIYTIE